MIRKLFTLKVVWHCCIIAFQVRMHTLNLPSSSPLLPWKKLFPMRKYGGFSIIYLRFLMVKKNTANPIHVMFVQHFPQEKLYHWKVHIISRVKVTSNKTFHNFKQYFLVHDSMGFTHGVIRFAVTLFP